MEKTVKIALYLLAVVLLGALATPYLFWMLRALEPWALANGLMNWDPKNSEVLVRGPLDFVSRDFQSCFVPALAIAALVAAPPAAYALGIRRPSHLQLVKNRRWWSHLLRGLLYTGGFLVIIGATCVLNNLWPLKAHVAWLHFVRLEAIAFCGAILSEIVYRGLIMGFIQQVAPKPVAIAVTTVLSTAVYLISVPAVEDRNVQWISGFEALPHLYDSFLGPLAVLTLAGCLALNLLLSYARASSNSLWFPLGLQIGAQTSSAGFAAVAAGKPLPPWLGTSLLAGLAPVIVFIFALLLVRIRIDHEEMRPLAKKRPRRTNR